MAAEPRVPRPAEVKSFVADAPPAFGGSAFFKDFRVSRETLQRVLMEYHAIGREHWESGYSHVGLADRTGHIVLKDGRKVFWMVKPGGLAWLSFPDGKRVYLAREKTEWPRK